MIVFSKSRDKENEFEVADVTFEIPNNEVTLTELLQEFECFLKACGYSFKGELDFTEDTRPDQKSLHSQSSRGKRDFTRDK